MKRLIPVFLMLILMSAPVYADDLQDGLNAYQKQDLKEAVRLFSLSAEQGDVDAQTLLGSMYSEGLGVPQNYKESLKWYRLAAEQGAVGAQYNLGTMYGKGYGVPQNYKEAVRWYKLAAEQGAVDAQVNLGMMYANGEGVSRDYIKAHKWINIAVANGFENGRKTKDLIEKQMTPDQIAEAQKLAREWMNEHGKE